MNILILGCGFTGERVARRFLERGARVTVTARDPERLANLGAEAIRLDQLRVNPGALVLHSIPPEGSQGVLEILGDAPARVVYLSTTGVYGNQKFVNESTPVAPETESHRSRVVEERRVAAGPWSSLILRPAAIYGPGRGVHEALRRGTCKLGGNFISRIHVDDLAAHVEAALLSEITGAYPVADEEPCTSTEIAEFCARLLHLPLPGGAGFSLRGQNTDRQVDGSAIRRALRIKLAYPSYRIGIPASIQTRTC